jgi:hypothetical protein
MRYNKYSNIKTKTSDGIEFDSKAEARRWIELKLLERAGEIKDLQRQVKYILIPTQKEGKKVIERECSYVADFVYTDVKTGKTVVEDTKGVKTKEYIIKRKLMLYVHNIKIKEVK